MIKLPFLNRKRYIILKCYTWHKGVFLKSPISLGHPNAGEIDPGTFLRPNKSFKSCYGRLINRKKSVTVFAPCDIRFQVTKDEGIENTQAPGDGRDLMNIDYKHDLDSSYKTHRNICVAKIATPWRIDDKSGTHFVVAKHMQNTTVMNIPSGITSFAASSNVNTFMHIPNITHQFEIPYLTPMIGLYPMTDKPIHIETYCDVQKWDELQQIETPLKYKAAAIQANL